MHKVVDRVRDVGIDLPTEFDIQVENIVASSKIDAKLNLEEIAFALENAEYEPEQFPGLVYRINEPRAAALIFSSGKIVCTGAKSIEMAILNDAFEMLNIPCRECGRPMKVAWGPKGPFPGCSGYPECQTSEPWKELRERLKQKDIRQKLGRAK
jgi:hypothetical protein